MQEWMGAILAFFTDGRAAAFGTPSAGTISAVLLDFDWKNWNKNFDADAAAFRAMSLDNYYDIFDEPSIGRVIVNTICLVAIASTMTLLIALLLR